MCPSTWTPALECSERTVSRPPHHNNNAHTQERFFEHSRIVLRPVFSTLFCSDLYFVCVCLCRCGKVHADSFAGGQAAADQWPGVSQQQRSCGRVRAAPRGRTGPAPIVRGHARSATTTKNKAAISPHSSCVATTALG